MAYIGRNTGGQIVIESIEPIIGKAEELIGDSSLELLAWRGATNRVDDRSTPRRTLRQKPDSAPVTIKDLKDLGLL